MDGQQTIPPEVPERDLEIHSRFPDALRSWAWRYYDDLLTLLLYNFLWAGLCLGVPWLSFRTGFFGTTEDIHWPLAALFYFFECVISIPFAFAVFRIFSTGSVALREIWPGCRRYGLKAVGLAAVWGPMMALGVFNIRFYFSMHGRDRFLYLLLASFVLSLLVVWISMAIYQWPILFFQDPPFWKIIQKSFYLVLSGGFFSLGVLILFVALLGLFLLMPFLWFFAGPALLFSFQTVALEKRFLRYRITFQDKSLAELMALLERERQRGWHDLLKPWENR